MFREVAWEAWQGDCGHQSYLVVTARRADDSTQNDVQHRLKSLMICCDSKRYSQKEPRRFQKGLENANAFNNAFLGRPNCGRHTTARQPRAEQEWVVWLDERRNFR